MMILFSEILALLLLVPYFGWGIYTLRLRFRYNEDLPFHLETATILALILFYAVELALLRTWLDRLPVQMLFAVLGLIVSGAALYGPMVVSLVSQALVDVVMPTARSGVSEPNYTPAEALERRGEYEGAVREYMVIARLFPKEATPAIRVGDNLAKLGRSREAAPWFERGLRLVGSPDRSLQIANRLFEIYSRQLDQPEQGVRVLEDYLERFPDADYADAVRQRLERARQTLDTLNESEAEYQGALNSEGDSTALSGNN